MYRWHTIKTLGGRAGTLAGVVALTIALAGCPSENPDPNPSGQMTTGATVETSSNPTAVVSEAPLRAISPGAAHYNARAIDTAKGSYDQATDTLLAIGTGFPPEK